MAQNYGWPMGDVTHLKARVYAFRHALAGRGLAWPLLIAALTLNG
jgi:hypothetical protein